MKYLAILALVILVGCNSEAKDNTKTSLVTFDELQRTKPTCATRKLQQDRLRETISYYNLGGEPDNMDEQKRAFNGVLKATLWWYEANCNEN
jgi:hypothetical protein